MSHRFCTGLLIACSVIAASSFCSAGHASDDSAATDHAKYLRIAETPKQSLSLQIATVDFEPAAGAPGPRIALVGVAHIADEAFYRHVQDVLDDYDLVLFEGVQPLAPARLSDGEESPEAAAERTRESMEFVAAMIEAYRIDKDRLPETVDELRRFAQSQEQLAGRFLDLALVDAWGGAISFELNESDNDGDPKYFLVSLGADGKEGGEGADSDISFAAVEVKPFDMHQENLQQQLADALGMKYQLQSLTYDALHWRPSDMSMDELNEALAARGVDFALVGGTLAGTSFSARVVQGLLRIVSLLDGMAQGALSDMLKIMMIELLGDEQLLKMSMSGMGEAFAEVILDERNQVVIDDLERIVRDEPEITSVAVLYGAAHLPDLASRLDEQLAYQPSGTRWLDAISIDLNASQLSPAQMQRMRVTIRRMMHQQMRQMTPPRPRE